MVLAALTDAEHVTQWLGAVRRLSSSGTFTVGTGHDMYVVSSYDLLPHGFDCEVSYLGFFDPVRLIVTVEGAEDPGWSRVRWSETCDAPGVPRVMEAEGRARADVWDTHLDQLADYLAGVPAPLCGRRSAQFQCHLDSMHAAPLHRAHVLTWLPVSGPAPGSVKHWHVITPQGPWRLPVLAWDPFYDERLTAVVMLHEAPIVVRASVTVVGTSTVLTLSDDGWDSLKIGPLAWVHVQAAFRASMRGALAQLVENTSA